MIMNSFWDFELILMTNKSSNNEKSKKKGKTIFIILFIFQNTKCDLRSYSKYAQIDFNAIFLEIFHFLWSFSFNITLMISEKNCIKNDINR